MELRHLRYFVAVAEEQNITRAAARLHVSQPPLSRQIRALEEELGVALLDHGPRSVRLTDAGRVFLVEAAAVLRRSEEAVETVRSVARGHRGELHVGYAPSLTVDLLPQGLRAFHGEHPGVRIHLHDLSTDEMLRGLGEGSLQVALLIRPVDRSLEGLEFHELRRHAVCLALHPAHPLARGRTVRLDDVARERLLAYSSAQYPEYHDWLRRLFAPLRVPPPVSEEHDGATSLVASVEAGRGVALVQDGFDCFAGPRLALRRLRPAPPPFIVGVAIARDTTSLPARAFTGVVRTLAAASPATVRNRRSRR